MSDTRHSQTGQLSEDREKAPREQQLCTLLLECRSNREIAAELGITPRTVKARLNRMFAKYGITDGVKRVKLAVLLYRKQNLAG
jgi:DNA-binding NarL/FixJ family response regulator